MSKLTRGNVTYVSGEKDATYVCISSETRPGPWHAWLRAPIHIWHHKDLNFFEKMALEADCVAVAAALCPIIPPKRIMVL